MMEIANGLVITSKDHSQPKYDVTPAEAVVLHKLHFAGAKGNPLASFVVLPGEAMTEIGKKRVQATRKNLEGREVPVEIMEPILRARTAQEELARLRKMYPGTVKNDAGRSAPVVEVCFPGTVKHLPLKFEDLEGNLNGVDAGFFRRTAKPNEAVGSETLAQQRADLMEHTKPELVQLAGGMGLEIAEAAKKAEIVELIIQKMISEPAKLAA